MPKGGSRYGAGRPGHKLKTSQTRSIDVRRWKRDGLLADGYFGWQWTDSETGKVESSIGVDISYGLVTLIYTTNGQSYRNPISIVRTSCSFGGERVWFSCPRCRQRCAKLYLRWGHFRCRSCSQITYPSQSEDVLERLWRAQSKIEARLGPHRTKPKHMHLKTFDRLVARYWQIEIDRDEAFCKFVDRMLSTA